MSPVGWFSITNIAPGQKNLLRCARKWFKFDFCYAFHTRFFPLSYFCEEPSRTACEAGNIKSPKFQPGWSGDKISHFSPFPSYIKRRKRKSANKKRKCVFWPRAKSNNNIGGERRSLFQPSLISSHHYPQKYDKKLRKTSKKNRLP